MTRVLDPARLLPLEDRIRSGVRVLCQDEPRHPLVTNPPSLRWLFQSLLEVACAIGGCGCLASWRSGWTANLGF